MTMTLSGNGAVSGMQAAFQTGDLKFAMRTSTPAGWIPATGTATIGGDGSNSTYTGLAYFALFSLWWAEFNDANCPLYTSAGNPVARGANAGADWDAGKRLTVFDSQGRFIRVKGTLNTVTIVAGGKYADTLKDHTHAAPSSGGGVRKFQSGGTSPWVADGPATSATENWSTLSPSTGAAAETAGASLGVSAFWKL